MKKRIYKDDIVEVLSGEYIGNRYYVKATARFSNGEDFIEVPAFAREPDKIKLPMDEPQVTGSCSSYARKYALNGLLCIDDTKDADATNDHKEEKAPTRENPTDPTWKKVADAKKAIGDKEFTKAKKEAGLTDVYTIKDANALLLAINSMTDKGE